MFPPPPLLVLSFLLLSTTTSATSPPQFRQAPRFYNSVDCVDQNPVHVAMTLDAAYLRGSMAAIHSILQHATCPESLHFHFVVSDDAPDGASSPRAAVTSSFPDLNFRFYPFDGDTVAGLISASLRPALDRPLNYARTYLAALLPASVRRVVYLDSDVVLVADIAGLAASDLGGAAVIAAPEHCGADIGAYFTAAFWSSPALSAGLAGGGGGACYFNTGVMVMDLGRWRAGGYTGRIEGWMEVQRRVRIYELGSLPPFLLVFAGRVAAVDRRWNQHGLGGDNFEGRCRGLHPGPVSLLHWSGKGKPWARIDAGQACPVDALWAPYDLLRSPRVLDL